MAKRELTTRTIFIVLIGVAALAIMAIRGELEKRRLASDYAKAQATIRQIEDDWIRLNRELSDARQTVETQSTDLSQLHTQFETLQTRLAQTEHEVTQLHAQYTDLQHTNTSLADQLVSATEQKDALEAKLSSVRELRFALRDLTHKMWQQRWQAWMEHIQMNRQQDDTKLAQGNRGYVVRNGVSTLSTETRLQVRVLEPETP